MKPVNRVRETRRAVGRLIDNFGATVLVQLDTPEEMSWIGRLKLRIEAEERVEFCTACPLHRSRGGDTETPLTPYWSPYRLSRAGRVAVITDAPTMQEHTAGELGHGPLFQTVRAELRQNGIDPDHITYLTTVACTPLLHARGGVRRTPPDPAHSAICVSNLMQSLKAADVDYVLLLGGHAARAWRRDLSLEHTAGHWFVWDSRWMVFPAEHPSVVLSRAKSISATEWREHLGKFCRGVRDRVGLEQLSFGCMKSTCREGTYAYDDDGVPWCHEHFKAGKATRGGRVVKTVDTNQQQLM